MHLRIDGTLAELLKRGNQKRIQLLQKVLDLIWKEEKNT